MFGEDSYLDASYEDRYELDYDDAGDYERYDFDYRYDFDEADRDLEYGFDPYMGTYDSGEDAPDFVEFISFADF